METPLSFWIAFNAGILILLLLDLFVFHRSAHEVSFRESLLWSIVWIALSMAFCAFVWHWKGADKGLEFFTGYLIEYSLSVDNIFIFVLIFTHFKVPREYQHTVLFWGVLGALIMRGIMIGVGVVLVQRFHWVMYVFGAFLVITGLRMFFQKEDDDAHLENIWIFRWAKKVFPFTNTYEGKHFVVHKNGQRFFTPLMLVLIMVESTDLIFALDSIPAIFSITKDPFIVYTSNVCAVLGLRSLYFLLASFMQKFIFLKAGLAVVLSFVGVKMLIADFYEIPTIISLSVIGAVLITAVVTSVFVSRWIENKKRD
ncbi:MAG: TerC family protein [Verrucomicrobiae bacterium]|nr:TerC family protein [Verrucomicrobiae bacterium]